LGRQEVQLKGGGADDRLDVRVLDERVVDMRDEFETCATGQCKLCVRWPGRTLEAVGDEFGAK
jgi:hypothetical protein